MKTPEEVLRGLANDPARLLEYVGQLQQELSQTKRALEEKAHQLTETREELALRAQQLAEAQAIIADLRRELFGAKSDKLTEEQEEQLRRLSEDAHEQTQRTAPLSQEVLEEALAHERAEQHQRAKERRRRHLPPVELEKQQVILEPEDRLCPASGEPRPRQVDHSRDRAPQIWELSKALLPGSNECGAAAAPGAPKQVGAGLGGPPASEPL